MQVLIKENERIDDLQRNGYRIIQDPDRFCFGMDAVLLSGFAAAKKGDKVLDMGTGTGIIPILMEAKTEAEHLTGLEIQPAAVAVAVKQETRAHHVQMHLGIIDSGAGICAVAKLKINAPVMQGIHNSLIKRKLGESIFAVFFTLLVGDGKVGVNALVLQCGQAAGADEIFDALLKIAALAEKAQPAHAGVELYVGFQLFAEL